MYIKVLFLFINSKYVKSCVYYSLIIDVDVKCGEIHVLINNKVFNSNSRRSSANVTIVTNLYIQMALTDRCHHTYLPLILQKETQTLAIHEEVSCKIEPVDSG